MSVDLTEPIIVADYRIIAVALLSHLAGLALGASVGVQSPS